MQPNGTGPGDNDNDERDTRDRATLSEILADLEASNRSWEDRLDERSGESDSMEALSTRGTVDRYGGGYAQRAATEGGDAGPAAGSQLRRRSTSPLAGTRRSRSPLAGTGFSAAGTARMESGSAAAASVTDDSATPDDSSSISETSELFRVDRNPLSPERIGAASGPEPDIEVGAPSSVGETPGIVVTDHDSETTHALIEGISRDIGRSARDSMSQRQAPSTIPGSAHIKGSDCNREDGKPGR